MEMSVGMLDHYNVSTRKLGDTIRFYEEVLGLTNGPRPPFNFPGAWLYSAGHRCCTSTTFPPPTGNNPRTPG